MIQHNFETQDYNSMLEMVGCSMCIIDINGHIISANKHFIAMLGAWHDEPIKGKHFCTLIHFKKHKKAKKVFENIISTATCAEDCENTYKKTSLHKWKIVTVDNKILTIIANVTYIYNDKKEPNIIVSMIDITDMRKLKKGQRESKKILIAQSKMAAMGEMLGAIAHQWRQPLNILALMVQDVPFMYSYSELTEEYTRKFADEAMLQINLMSKTIDDFRNFFQKDKKLSEFKLTTQTKKALELINQLFQSQGIDIILKEKHDPLVCGYPNEIIQVILNILTNAKDAFESAKKDNNPQIKIAIYEHNSNGVIAIEDNAGGIPEHIIDRIFEPYFTTKPHNKGTGIGLYMSKMIIETNMGGTLTVRNSEDGAVFTLKIPLAHYNHNHEII